MPVHQQMLSQPCLIPIDIGQLSGMPSNAGFTNLDLQLNPSVEGEPFIQILAEPKNKWRYRYSSEKGNHGCLTAKRTKKDPPSIKLENYNGNGPVHIKASLYTDEVNPQLHVHSLKGQNCNKNGECIVPLDMETKIAKFENIQIQHCGNKNVSNIIKARIEVQHLESMTEESKRDVSKEVDAISKGMNSQLNCVKICFEALCGISGVRLCSPAFSQPIIRSNCVESGDLKIIRLSQCSCSAKGGQLILMFCEKVNKKNIKIKFYDNSWEDYADFSESDVHHQYGIAFKTPPYKDQEINQPVRVSVQLFRPNDNCCSEARDFHYYPVDRDEDGIDRKRRKVPFRDFGESRGPFSPSTATATGYPHQPTSEASAYSTTSGPFHHCSSIGSESTDASTNDISISSDEQEIDPEFYTYLGNTDSFPESYLLDPSKDPVLCSNSADEVSNPQDLLFKRMLFENTSDISINSLFFTTDSVKSDFNYIDLHQGERIEFESPRIIENLDSMFHKTLTISSEQPKVQHGTEVQMPKPPRNYWNKIFSKNEDGDNIFHQLLLCQDSKSFAALSFEEERSSLMLKMLLKLNRKCDKFLNQQNKLKQTPLHLAALTNSVKELDLLIQHGADPNFGDRNGNTAVHLAVNHKMIDCLKQLAMLSSPKKGRHFNIDINCLNYDGLTPLHCAIVNTCLESIMILCEAGADLSLGEGKCGQTVLHYSVLYFPDSLKYLLAQPSVDINACDYAGNSALNIAFSKNMVEETSLLIKAGADPKCNSYTTKWNHKNDVSESEDSEEDNGLTDVDLAEGITTITENGKDLLDDKESFIAKAMKMENGVNASSRHDDTVRLLDVATTMRLAQLLDPPEGGWQILASYLSIDDDIISTIAETENSPTTAIINFLQKSGGDIEVLLNAMKFAELHDAHDVVKSSMKS